MLHVRYHQLRASTLRVDFRFYGMIRMDYMEDEALGMELIGI